MTTILRVLAAAACCAILAAPPLTSQSVYPTGTTIWDPAAADNGYTLFAAEGGSVFLIDMDGTVVNEWQSPFPGHHLTVAEPLDNGSILAFSHDPVAQRGNRRDILELSYAGEPGWSYSFPAQLPETWTMHHDSERLPNGNTLILCRQTLVVPSISLIPLRDDFLLEVDAAGNKVWGWETWKHFDQLGFSRAQKKLIAQLGGDWSHSNTVSVIPPNAHFDPAFAEGNLIVSQRHSNLVFIIDRTTGDIVWQIGPDPFNLTHGQHLPHMIELGLPGQGNILVFDNGSGTGYASRLLKAPGRSSIKEIDPVTKQVVWEYQEDIRFFSDAGSNAQRLPNGNTMICSTAKGRLFEVDPIGNIVWEYMSPYFLPQGLGSNHRVYRAYRLPYTWAP